MLLQVLTYDEVEKAIIRHGCIDLGRLELRVIEEF